MNFNFLSISLIFGVLCNVKAGTKSILKLHEILQQNYSAHIRPVSSDEETLKVNISGRFNQILKMDDVEQMLLTDLWVENTWYDAFLTWNESEYPQSIILPVNSIWKPDLIFYDGQQGDKQSLNQLSNNELRVMSDGKVTWDVKTVITTACHMELEMFPWDRQTCNISLGPWLYHEKEVKIVTGEVIKSQELGTSTWDVISINHYTIPINVYGHTYSQIIFEVHLARKPLFYLVNLLAPCSLLAGLAILAYLLPIDSGERVSLPVTLFLSEIVFLISVTSYIPLTSEVVPRLSIMIGCLVVSMAFTIVSSVITIYVHGKHNKPPTSSSNLLSGCLKTTKEVDEIDNEPVNETNKAEYGKKCKLTGERLNTVLGCINTILLVAIYLWITYQHVTNYCPKYSKV